MAADIDDRLATMARERARLETLLAKDPDWQMLVGLEIGAPSDGADTRRAELEARLAANPHYLALRLLLEAHARLETAARLTSAPALPNGARKPADGRAAASGTSRVPPKIRPGRNGDDLTRLRGVGPVLAMRMKAHGITSYAQIAVWSDGDVARVSDTLRLGGRIERDGWRAQARDLAGVASAPRAGLVVMAETPLRPKRRSTVSLSDAIEATAPSALAATEPVSAQKETIEPAKAPNVAPPSVHRPIVPPVEVEEAEVLIVFPPNARAEDAAADAGDDATPVPPTRVAAQPNGKSRIQDPSPIEEASVEIRWPQGRPAAPRPPGARAPILGRPETGLRRVLGTFKRDDPTS